MQLYVVLGRYAMQLHIVLRRDPVQLHADLLLWHWLQLNLHHANGAADAAHEWCGSVNEN